MKQKGLVQLLIPFGVLILVILLFIVLSGIFGILSGIFYDFNVGDFFYDCMSFFWFFNSDFPLGTFFTGGIIWMILTIMCEWFTVMDD
jgi:hypothetical protein